MDDPQHLSLPYDTRDRIHTWLCGSPEPALAALPNRPPTPPRSPSSQLRKHRRDSSLYDSDMEGSRDGSPKRRRGNDDNIAPAQSVSQVGVGSVLALSERTTLTATGTGGSGVVVDRKRSVSPSRHLTALRTAQPAITLGPITMHKTPLPKDVAVDIGKLRKRLSARHGYIPAGLQEAICRDPVFLPSLDIDPIDEEEFDEADSQNAAELADTLRRVKTIFQNARLCTEYGRDENAWCFDVVYPLLELAIKLHGKDKWRCESVQSQSLSPRYLSSIPDPTHTSPTRMKTLYRKTDFCFSTSRLDPAFASLYDHLERTYPEVSHTTDNFTSRVALFSGIEVKPENGDHKEAELQMGIWMAGSLRKKASLATQAVSGFQPSHASTRSAAEEAGDIAAYPLAAEADATPGVTLNVNTVPPLEPAITIIGHEHKVYYAYLSGSGGDVTILGPDEKLVGLTTRSVQGIFRLVRFYGAVLEYCYGVDEEETEKGVWGTFLGPVLRVLAGNGGGGGG
ncbi:uncharacterized protein BDR25DRAFT_344352 [Lindgomyces ingoldianus]|uniref:Uncharacterized protein n=1 Tax=Lindgomyces ingoldianus TaxID=673940 RepID=A0ACB6QN66_9PLEO|nr:uncharacterized protein BDR25DRAFT_344352 [Lindgomyces ingoldianus]KAF2468393.1 hypothetical protein BDR25DRAFT_344352 [Lindgomyces ingoldianus]